MHLCRLVDSPVEYFRARLQEPPRWLLALSVLLVVMAVETASALILVHRLAAESLPDGVPAVIVALGLLSVVSVFSFFFWLVALGAVMAGCVFLPSGQVHRLVECTALAYVVVLPWGLVKLWVVLVWMPVDIPLTLYMFWVIDWFHYLWVVALMGGAVYAGGSPKHADNQPRRKAAEQAGADPFEDRPVFH